TARPRAGHPTRPPPPRRPPAADPAPPAAPAPRPGPGAAAAAPEGTRPAQDLSASPEYREHLARVLTRRAVLTATGMG
ncbi:xanthine dehydrogenase family protein subunit M, partial [Streptomyces sp. NPDC059627]